MMSLLKLIASYIIIVQLNFGQNIAGNFQEKFNVIVLPEGKVGEN